MSLFEKYEMPSSGERISLEDGSLVVPDNPVIPFIIGDGIGPDIWRAAVRVLDAAVEKAYSGQKKIAWYEVFAGQKSFDQFGEWLPQDTITAIQHYLVSIKGPLTTPVGGGIRSINVALRQGLDLYACVRPVQYFEGVPSPVKHPELIDMVIFRENTEDIYAGIEWEEKTPEAKKMLDFLQQEMNVKNIRFPDTTAIGIKPISKEGSQRLVRSAIQYAIDNQRKSVTLVHKGNIMKFTEGAFKDWGYEVAAKEFGDQVFTWVEYERIQADQGKEAADQAQVNAQASGKIIVKDSIADAFFQEILIQPAEYDVVATMNLNGDYISDALAAQVGGIGIAPGANINYITGHAVFEATHGTAPSFADLDKLNPSSVILSGEIMLRYMGWTEAADLITRSIAQTIASKQVTCDFARALQGATELKTSEFGDAVINNM